MTTTPTPAELRDQGRAYANARRDLQERRYWLSLAVRHACDEGMAEVEAAKLAGISRMTVRAWRGKK